MYASSKLIFYLCKIMGITPVIIVKNEYKFSRWSFFRNIIFLICVIVIGLHALLSDFESTMLGKSVRMKSRTSIVITFLEILLSMVVVSSGILGAPFYFNKIVQMDRLMKNVDEQLQNECDLKIFNLIICYIITHQIVLIYMDMRFWLNLTPYSWSYAVCYVYFFVEIAIEAQFALIVLNIVARFRKINEYLANKLCMIELQYDLKKSFKTVHSEYL